MHTCTRTVHYVVLCFKKLQLPEVVVDYVVAATLLLHIISLWRRRLRSLGDARSAELARFGSSDSLWRAHNSYSDKKYKPVVSGLSFPFRSNDKNDGTTESWSAETMNFLAPTRRLLLKLDMRSFERSRAFARYITLVQVSRRFWFFSLFLEVFYIYISMLFLNFQALNSTARGAQLAEDCFVSPLIQRLLDALASVEIWIGQHPPKPHHFRYGNSAFREWVKRLQASVIGTDGTVL